MSSTAALAPVTVPALERSVTRSVRPAGAPVRSGVRLTRRGRVVLLGLVLVLGLVALVVGAASVSATTSSGPTTRSVVVQPGQTLWELAEQVAPDRDPRVVIAKITELNDLPGPIVAPGQALVVPSS